LDGAVIGLLLSGEDFPRLPVVGQLLHDLVEVEVGIDPVSFLQL
jgi:hypothetical protein